MVRFRNLAYFLSTAVAIAIAFAPAALAGGMNFGTTWQENFGARVYGKVQIQASYNDGGGHAAGAYQRFTRKSGPLLDTGRLYTTWPTSQWDPTVRSRTDWVWESLLPGSDYDTHHYYNFLWYGSGTCSALGGKVTPNITC